MTKIWRRSNSTVRSQLRMSSPAAVGETPSFPPRTTGQNLGGRVLKDSSVTFEWFVLNIYFPLRKGDWRPQTAKEKMSQIQLHLVNRFAAYPLDSFDKLTLQTHMKERKISYPTICHKKPQMLRPSRRPKLLKGLVGTAGFEPTTSTV